MGKLMAGLSISLDGFIAGPNDGLGNPLGDGGGTLFDSWTAGTERLGPDDRFRPPGAAPDGRSERQVERDSARARRAGRAPRRRGAATCCEDARRKYG